MDPDANLAEQLRLCKKLQDAADADWTGAEMDPVDTLRLVELQQALNEWISKGGALPKAWQHK